ncbi:hypothetical protein BDQ17DRAFT_154562 [Cyathus striatus]|nr:hypothetical protein BDQ17DRAFT_154562 [Cyathus striatus]
MAHERLSHRICQHITTYGALLRQRHGCRNVQIPQVKRGYVYLTKQDTRIYALTTRIYLIRGKLLQASAHMEKLTRQSRWCDSTVYG